MGGFPPPPSTPNPPPPPGGSYPPPGAGGWSAEPTAPTAPPFGAPGTYGPPVGYGDDTTRYDKAGFWTRFAAFVIDAIVTGFFFLPAYIALLAGPTEIESCSLDSSGNIDFDGTVQNGLCEVPTGGTIAVAVILGIVGFVGVLAYWAKLEGGSGQSVGKRALSIRTVDMASGQPIGGGRAIGRYFARILSSIPCFLGYFWMLWDPQKQAWHDKLANDLVVKD
jgi:uncharacterized RDD family membrane protein YckC